MDLFLQLLVTGIAAGGIYALVAMGFVLIYKATRIINFATGEFMMIGAYFFYTCWAVARLPPAAAFAVVLICAAGLGWVVERLILRHMLGQPVISVVMVTLGLSSILTGTAELIWSAEFLSFPPLFPRAPIVLGTLVIRSNQFWGFVIAMIAAAAFALALKFSRVGVAMRAAADDPTAAYSMGINVRAMFTLAWALGAMAASLGGVLIANIGGLQPSLGQVALKIFPVVILGGLESIAGAVIGGILIGIIENMAGGYLDPYVGGGVKDLAPFVVLVAILMIKPYGLFGKQDIERL